MSIDGIRGSQIDPSAYRPADAASKDAGATSPLPTGPYRMEPSWNPALAGLLSTLPALGNAGGGNAANSVDFDAQVRGQDAKAIDLEMMEISAAVYDPAVTEVGDWTRLTDEQLLEAGIDPSMLENPDTGFRAGIYTDGEGRHVLAFAGSNELQDWTGPNFQQGVGWSNEQYDQAVELAQLADTAFGDSLVITGHSLGGGLAATASLATGNAAVTFNASGVHDNTMERLGLDPDTAKADAADGQIRRYNISGDPLTAAQEDTWGTRTLMPDAPGHEINLDDPYPPIEGPEFTWNPIEMGKRIYEHGEAKLQRAGDLHGQQGVLDALRQQQPWN